jgi:hypothetical protein
MMNLADSLYLHRKGGGATSTFLDVLSSPLRLVSVGLIQK